MIVERRAWLLLVLGLAALGVLLPYASGWRVDNRLESWARTPSEGYALLLEGFGGDEFVLVRADGFELEDGAQLAWLSEIGQQLACEPAVRAVLDPFRLPGAASTGPREALERAAERPLARALDLVTLSSPRADFVLEIDTSSRPEERRALSRTLERLEERAAELGLWLRSAGHPVVGTALDEEAARVERVFAPLLALAGLVATAVALRSLRLSLLTLLPAIGASAAARAGLRALGIPSNMILVAVGPLVFVLTVASVLHVVSAFRRLLAEGVAPEPAAREARRRIFVTAMLAAVTTAVGFGVFGLAPVLAVRQLGLAAAIAILVTAPLSHLAVPVLLGGLVPAPRPGERPPKGWLPAAAWRRFAAGARRRRWVVVSVAVVLLGFGAAAPFAVEFGTNAVDYFPAGHPVREAFLTIEDEGGALSSLDLLVERGDPKSWETSERLTAELSALGDVVGVFGPEAVREDLRSMAGPMASLLLEPALVEAQRTDPSGEWLRYSVRMRTGSSEFTRGVAEKVLEVARRVGAGRAFATGSLMQLLGLQSELTETLATSLGWTTAFIAISFLIVVRRPFDWSVAMLVNVTPVAAVLAAAWGFGLSLDAATVMVASVVMGLAVDNTFHLLRAGRGHGEAPLRLRLRAFERVGEAAATSSLALASGFGLLALSPFAPTARFGLLCAIGVLAAFFGDFALLPAVWLRAPRRALRYGGGTGPRTGRHRRGPGAPVHGLHGAERAPAFR